MDTPLRHALIELKRNDRLPIKDGQGRSVIVFSGLLWLTQEGDRRDVFLGPGQSFTIERPGLSLIEAVDDTSLLVLEPDDDQPASKDKAPHIAVRPLRQQDRPLLDRLIRELSPATRYRRFHAAVNELSPQWLNRLMQVRAPSEAALMATVGAGEREFAVGEARYGAV